MRADPLKEKPNVKVTSRTLNRVDDKRSGSTIQSGIKQRRRHFRFERLLKLEHGNADRNRRRRSETFWRKTVRREELN